MEMNHNQRKESKRTRWLIEVSARDLFLKKKYEEKVIPEDTKIRKEIHTFIERQSNQKGISKERLLNEVRVQFADEKFKKYQEYFETWVNDMMKKRAVIDNER